MFCVFVLLSSGISAGRCCWADACRQRITIPSIRELDDHVARADNSSHRCTNRHDDDDAQCHWPLTHEACCARTALHDERKQTVGRADYYVYVCTAFGITWRGYMRGFSVFGVVVDGNGTLQQAIWVKWRGSLQHCTQPYRHTQTHHRPHSNETHRSGKSMRTKCKQVYIYICTSTQTEREVLKRYDDEMMWRMENPSIFAQQQH